MSQVGEVNVFEDAQLLEAGDQRHHLQAIVGYYTDQSAVSPGKQTERRRRLRTGNCLEHLTGGQGQF